MRKENIIHLPIVIVRWFFGLLSAYALLRQQHLHSLLFCIEQEIASQVTFTTKAH